MSDSILPNNIDKEAFEQGYKSKLEKAAFGLGSVGALGRNIGNTVGNKLNGAVEGYIGNRTAKVLQPTLDSARQAGIKFDTNSQGMPVNFDTNGSINNVAKNYISNAGSQLKNWATDQFGQATKDPIAWAKNNPWTAGGTALAGGGLLYGAGKMLFGGSHAPQQSSSYMVPQANPYMTPQALQKSSGLLPMFHQSLGLPSMLAQNLAGGQEMQGPQQQQPQAPSMEPEMRISADDPKLHKLLNNPKMQSYLRELVSRS